MATTTDGRKAAYALIGAPVWAAKRLAEFTSDLGDISRREMQEWIKEGERITKRLSDKKVVEELSERVDLEQIQDQVERLRDQLESVLGSWRDSFRPDKPTARKPAAKKPATRKPAAKKPSAKKPAAKPAAKKPAAKKPAAKKPAARKPAAKPAAKKTTSSTS
ncbi:MAG: histone H1-like repetitive region-containing protein [Acidimicrobiia bacterium]